MNKIKLLPQDLEIQLALSALPSDISIKDPGCTSKTFPDYFEHFEKLVVALSVYSVCSVVSILFHLPTPTFIRTNASESAFRLKLLDVRSMERVVTPMNHLT